MYSKSLNYRPSSIFGAIMVVVVAYFCGRKVLDDPMMLMGMLFVILMALFFMKKPALGLAVLIIFGINIFGAIQLWDFPSISIGGLGSLLVPDILLLLFLAITFLKSFGRRSISTRSSISQPLIAFILLTVLEGILSFLGGTDIHFITNSMRGYAYYLLYFLMLSSIRTEDELIRFMKLMVIIAIITAGVVYYQAITGDLIPSINKRYIVKFGYYQTLNVAAGAMVCVFLCLLALVSGEKVSIKYSLAAVLIMSCLALAILLMMVRGLWVSVVLAGLIIIVYHSAKALTSIVWGLAIFALIIAGFSATEDHLGSSKLSYIMAERFSSVDQSFEKRGKIMMGIRLHHLIDNPSLFGYGFRGKRTFEVDRLDPSVVTGHNLPGDLAARFGFSGFLIFGWLLFAVFRQAIRLLVSLPVSWQKSLICGLLAFNVQSLVYSYSANTYFHTCGIVIIVSSWAVLDLIERFHKNKQMTNVADTVSS